MNQLQMKARALELRGGGGGLSAQRRSKLQGGLGGLPPGVRMGVGNSGMSPLRNGRAVRPAAVIAGARAHVRQQGGGGERHKTGDSGRRVAGSADGPRMRGMQLGVAGSQNGIQHGRNGLPGGQGGNRRPASFGGRNRPGSGRFAAEARARNAQGAEPYQRGGMMMARGTADGASGGEPHFIPSARFQGPKDGYAFKSGASGTGYYRDAPSGGLLAAPPRGGDGGGQIVVSFDVERIGLSFVDRSAPLVIQSITPGSAAAAQLQLHPGLILVAVQYQNVSAMPHEHILRLIQACDRPLILGFDHPPSGSDMATAPPASRGSAQSVGSESRTLGDTGTEELVLAPELAEGGAGTKPKKMVRAKGWDESVEAAYRYQAAGWRDQREYQLAHGSVTVWAGTTWAKCLKCAGTSDLMYFGKKRECANSLCARVKIFIY
eukprot:COSAG05_NODE_26_length_29797_cov_35.911139_15_plen_434_part_00